MTVQAGHLVWLDLEMTGLRVESDCILEIATLITDSQLNIIAVGPNLAIHQPEAVLAAMNPWCIKTHGDSGLTQRVRESQWTVADAEAQTLAFIQTFVPPQTSPLCGNSIGQDRRFLDKYMPQLDAYLHYRSIDVSTVKELARRWAPQVLAHVQKKGSHLALDDIRESVSELKYYKEHFFMQVADSSDPLP